MPWTSPDGAITVPHGWGASWWNYTPAASASTRKAMVVFGDSTTYGSGGNYSWLQRLRDRAVSAGYTDGGKGFFAGLEQDIVYDSPEINGIVSTNFAGSPDGFDTLVGSWLYDTGTVGHTHVSQFRESNVRIWYMKRSTAGSFSYDIKVSGSTVASGTINSNVASGAPSPAFQWVSGLPAGTKTMTVTNLGGGSLDQVRFAVDGVNSTGLQIQKQAMSGMTFEGMFFAQSFPAAPYTATSDGFRFQAPMGLVPNVDITGPDYTGMTVDTTPTSAARINPCLAITDLGFNDLTNTSGGGGGTPTTVAWTEYVRRFAAACRAAGVDGLVISGQLPYNANWPTYGAARFNAVKAEALAQGLAFADMLYPISGPSLSYAGGTTNPHLTKTQYQTQADWLWDNLLGLSQAATSTPMPDLTVEIAFADGYSTPAASRTWTDVRSYVEAQSLVNIERGRQDQFSTAQPARLSLTLDNRDGRFTPEYASGAYYPNVKKGRPIRVRTGGPVYLFTGYVNEWPVAWPGGSGTRSTVTVSASSRMERLGKSAEFRSIIEEEILNDGQDLLFTLGEPQGATTAGNATAGRSDILTATQYGAGGTLEFGAGAGPGTDDLTAPIFTPASTTDGLALTSTLVDPVTGAGETVLEVECFFNTTGSLIPIFFLWSTAGSGLGVTVAVTALGKALVSFSDAGGVFTSATGTATINDGETHHVAGRIDLSGGNVTASIVVDGAARVTGTGAAYTSTTLPTLNKLIVGGDGGSMFAGTIAHVALRGSTVATTDARVQAHSAAGLTGFVAEASGARIARYARLAGIPTAEVDVETGLSTSIAHKDTTGQAPLQLMEAVALTEDGIVFDAGNGDLTFHARSHRNNATSTFTLDCNAGEVEEGLLPRLDDQGMLNDVTASRPEGITARAVNQASIDDHGEYRENFDLLTTSDNEVQSRANWEVFRRGNPRVNVPNVRVNLASVGIALQESLLAAEIGDRFTITNLPTQAPSSSMDFFIEGISHQIGAGEYYIEFNASPVPLTSVWILGSATYSQLGTSTVLTY